MRNARILLLTVLAAPASFFAAAENLEVTPSLDPDPAVVKILNSLGPNQSAWLPPVKTTGPINETMKKFGLHKTGPRPRNYCKKWVWAPDRKRAFFCGANAGVPHRFNDVWEYDLAANTWVLLYEPDADFNRVRHMKPDEKQAFFDRTGMVTNGILMTVKGAPFDPIHSWWQITYEPNMHALLWVMGNQNKAGYPHKNKIPWGKVEMWAYYPFENRWEYFRPDKTHPPGQNASILEYIPDRTNVLWYTRSWRGCATSLFDGRTKKWTHKLGKKEMQKDPNCPPTEAVAAYQSHTNILVVHRGGDSRKGKLTPKVTYHYDLAANKWTKVLTSMDGPRGFDSAGPMTYDSLARQSYINHGGLWAYAVGDKAWRKLTPDGPGAPGGMACYNPEHNVLMVDPGRGKIWVYRHTKQ